MDRPNRDKMRHVCAEILIVLTLLSVINADNMTADTIEERLSTLRVNGSTAFYHRLVRRCWNSVIQGRPTMAKIVIAGSFFIFIALIAGLVVFICILCRYKETFAEVEDDLWKGLRCFKPQLEDVERGLLVAHVTRPVSFMKKAIKKIRRHKEHEVEDEESDEDEEDESEDEPQDEASEKESEGIGKLATFPHGGLSKTPVRKKREQIRDEEGTAEESPVHDGDPSKTARADNMTPGKAKGKEGKELRKKEKLKTEKGESSETSDPMKKKPGDKKDLKKKGKSDPSDHKKKETGARPKEDKKATGRSTKDPAKKTEGKTKKEEKAAKKTQKLKPPKVKKKKPEVTKKLKKEKIKAPKPPKTKTKKPKKEKSPKKPKKK